VTALRASLLDVTNDSRDETWAALSSRTHHVLGAPAPRRRLERDTFAALVATLIGATCLLVSALGVIQLWVSPLGGAAVVIASVATGLVVTLLLGGGFSAWLLDRRSGTSEEAGYSALPAVGVAADAAVEARISRSSASMGVVEERTASSQTRS
jgi:hypothetical protein